MEGPTERMLLPRYADRNKEGAHATGYVVAGRYRLKAGDPNAPLRVAEDTHRNTDVLLKIAPFEMLKDPRVVHDLRSAYQEAHRLHHPNILVPSDLIQEPDMLALVYPHLKCRMMSELLREQPEGCFAPDAVRHWMADLCGALDHAVSHHGLAHKNLTLESLLVDHKGVQVDGFATDRVFADWLAVRQPEDAAAFRAYMSPQSLDGSQSAVDDIFSVGVILFQLLSGEMPYSIHEIIRQQPDMKPPSVSEAREDAGRTGPKITKAWEETIAACLQHDPSLRPRGVNDLAQKLSLPGSKENPFATLYRCNRTKLWIGGAVTAVLLLLTGIWASYHWIIAPSLREKREQAARVEEEARQRQEEAEQARLAKEEEERRQIEETQRAAAEQEIAEARALAEAERLKNAHGTLKLVSIPEGATVTVGEITAITPIEGLVLPLGTHSVTVELQDHEPVRAEIKITDGGTVDLGTLQLVRHLGTLRINSSPEGAQVFLDGEQVGITPMVMENLPTGRWRFEFRKRGFNTTHQFGEIRNARETSLDVLLREAPGPKIGQDFTNPIGMKMIWIEKLEIWVAAHETTQEQFRRVMRSNPSEFRGMNHPVENVTWADAVEFCRRLTNGMRGQRSITASQTYRLPFGAEWDVFVADATWPPPEGARPTGTSPVDSGRPNRHGIFGLKGSVWEWCMDPYQGREDLRQLRGGSWLTDTRGMDMPVTDFNAADSRGNNRGFRVVLVFDSE